MSRVPAVYFDQTYRHDGSSCCEDGNTGVHLKDNSRADVDVEGRWGADNGMYYWRARVHYELKGLVIGKWTTWRPHEPGSIITREELYWDADHSQGQLYPGEITDMRAQQDILAELRDPATGLLS